MIVSDHKQTHARTCNGFYSRHGKRAFDLAFALALLPALLPVILLFAIATRLDGGPAFLVTGAWAEAARNLGASKSVRCA